MKCVHANHPGIEVGNFFQERPGVCSGVMAARERDMWMPGAKFRFEAGGKRCFLHTLVNLEKMRMTRTHPDPDNLWWTFRWKRSDAGYRQEESAEANGIEFFAQS